MVDTQEASRQEVGLQASSCYLASQSPELEVDCVAATSR